MGCRFLLKGIFPTQDQNPLSHIAGRFFYRLIKVQKEGRYQQVNANAYNLDEMCEGTNQKMPHHTVEMLPREWSQSKGRSEPNQGLKNKGAVPKGGGEKSVPGGRNSMC